MDTKTFENQWNTCLVCIPEWLEHQDAFTFEHAAAATGQDIETLKAWFGAEPHFIPRFFYEAALELYKEQRDQTEGFAEWTLSEKMTHFACTLFDIFDTQPDFVKASLYPLVLNASDKDFFFGPVAKQFQRFMDGDSKASALTRMWTPALVFEFWATEFGHVLRFWLKDTSDGKEKTLALIDKLSGFVQELYYNTTADRALDLARFFWQERIVKLPFGLDNWLRK
jgi:hypothetical protein